MAEITTIQKRKWFILRIEKVLVRWITPNPELDNWGLPKGGFDSDGVLYVQDGTISWNSPKISIWRERDSFKNLWGIWEKRYNLWRYYPYSNPIMKPGELFEFNSRIVHQVLKKTKTKSITLFGDI